MKRIKRTDLEGQSLDVIFGWIEFLQDEVSYLKESRVESLRKYEHLQSKLEDVKQAARNFLSTLED